MDRSLLTSSDRVLRPGRGQRSPWLREALAREPDQGAPSSPLGQNADYDVAILGGGYTGLWTAWFLIERSPDLRIAILERDICGGGPSGRNGGFVNAWWDDLPRLISLYGPERAAEAARASAASVRAIGDWCADNSVDAHYRRAGMLTVSTTPLHDGAGAELVEACRSVGEANAYRAMSFAEVQAVCGSPRFRDGALMADGATVQPALLARGLRRVLLGRGVHIHEMTEVRSVRRRSSTSVGLRTADGVEVRASQVVFAINAWSAGWRAFNRSLLTWGSYMARSEPIPEELDRLQWTAGEAIVDARFTVHYLRTTNDGRIAIGAGGGLPGYGGRITKVFTDADGPAMRAAYAFRLFFPQLANVRLTDAWGGPIDVSPTHLPQFGSLRGGRMHFGFGYSGNGVGPSHLGGQILAALALGSAEPLTRLPMVGPPLQRFPPEPFRYVGARILREAMIRREDGEEAGHPPSWPLHQLTRVPQLLGYQLGPK